MNSVLVIILILAIANCANLPSYFSQCSKTDANLNDCLLANTKTAWPTMVNGDSVYHIQPMNPLRVPFIHVDIDGNLQGNLSNTVIDGMQDVDFQEIKLDLAKNRLDLTFLIPRLTFIGDYEVDGRLLLVPIKGSGPANITFINMLTNYFLEYDIKEKRTKQYIHVKNSAMKYTVTRVYSYFSGYETLGIDFNKVLDENWEAVNEEVGANVGNAIGEIFTQILQSFFKKVSLNELFSD
ncbi:uncharacterized protein CBL_07092 [Carabus blaptoides fortunei]